MEAYKKDFIEFALAKNVLKKGGPFKLKSGRMSPYFFNAGDFSDGESAERLGQAYADALIASGAQFDVLFGPPYKGIPLVVMTAQGLKSRGQNTRFAYYRKEEKIGGEASGAGQSKADLRKKFVVGKLEEKDKVVVADDVITTGGAKYEALDILKQVTDSTEPVAVAIAMDRCEVGEYGASAVEQLKKETGMKVVPVITVGDFIDYMTENRKLTEQELQEFMLYLRAWGTPEIKEKYGLKEEHVIPGRTVIPACDVDNLEKFEQLVKATADIPKIGGYKLGFELGYGGKGWGLADAVELAKKHAPSKKVIFDHQKAGSDIPDTGAKFAKKMKNAGVDSIIVFAEAGPVTQVRWVGEALQQGMEVFVGGEMTHPGYKASEGGWIRDDALPEMYLLGAKQGVRNFIVPGNRLDRVGVYKELLAPYNPSFGSPGFVAQGGKISDAAKTLGEMSWHAIAGTAFTEKSDVDEMRKVAEELTSQL